ncbi:MAG: tripartite tricarboxylate transporter permease [Deltaproteobacteria bacterium]|nr:tripartite tricarboxylate transporter permease [Deltaproteobacteria bacterium]
MIEGLFSGLHGALDPRNFLAVVIGCLVGTIVGVLPGIGPTGTMALLLPLTYALGPTAGMIMLAGIWYGAQYGGSTTSILVNVPGEAASVVTTLDGYQMARKGKAGTALAIAAIGSFVAGTLGVVGLTLFAPPLANAALSFGPPEFFWIAIFGLLVLSNLSGKSTPKALLMATLGVILATVGMDPISGRPRFSMGSSSLFGGFDFVPVTMGLFGVAEILYSSAERLKSWEVLRVRFRDLYPNREDFRRSAAPIFRGGVVGFLVGLIPGPAAVMSSFVSYALERRLSRHPEKFGHGAIEGVAGPESANNAATAGGLVPLLALGLPFAPPTAVLLGGLMIHGVVPGPLLMQQHPDLFWGVIASMYIGNCILLILNLPLVGVFASITRVRPAIVNPIVLILCVIGAYAVNNSMFDVWVMWAFGLLGFFMRRLGFEAAPLVLGLVLGKMLENSFRQSMVILEGDIWGFWARPISSTLMVLAILALVMPPVIRLFLRSRPKHTS